MITRIEIDGLKSFVGFDMPAPPFVALLGPNASGKSNLADALQAIADAGEGRTLSGPAVRRGAPTELFHQRDDGGRLSIARLRCEVVVEAPELDGIVGLDCRVEMRHEALERGGRVRTKAVASPWTAAQLSSFMDRGASEHLVGQMDRAGRRLAAGDDRLDLSGATPASLYGAPFDSMLDSRQRAMWLLGRELRSWRFLSPAPTEMRERAYVTDQDPLEPTGANLAAVLGRLSATDAMWDLVTDAVTLIPGLRDLHVVQSREYWELELEFRGTGRVSPRVVSDGTLRVLAVLAALHDPESPGVLVLDEIENGLHPSLLMELLKRIRARVTDWRGSEELRTPLRQVIVTTHSPVVLSELFREHRDDLVFLSTVFHPWTSEETRAGSLVARARSVGEADQPGSRISVGEVRRLLETVQPAGSAR